MKKFLVSTKHQLAVMAIFALTVMSISTFAQTPIAMFNDFNVHDYYLKFSGFIDFLIFFGIFFVAARIAMRRYFEDYKKARPIVIAISTLCSVSCILAFNKLGMTLGEMFGDYILIIFLLVIITLTWKLLRAVPLKGKLVFIFIIFGVLLVRKVMGAKWDIVLPAGNLITNVIDFGLDLGLLIALILVIIIVVVRSTFAPPAIVN